MCTLSNKYHEESYSGNHICKKIDMFNEIVNSDICKITYTSGFNKGGKILAKIQEMIMTIENEQILAK